MRARNLFVWLLLGTIGALLLVWGHKRVFRYLPDPWTVSKKQAEAMALERFRELGAPVDDAYVVTKLDEEEFIEARLAERARTYRRRKTQAADAAPPTVRIDNAASSNATVIEVRAPDKVGILHRITKAVAEVGLHIRHAKIHTLGHEVVDTFYVVNAEHEKVTDEFHAKEIERAILHAVA